VELDAGTRLVYRQLLAEPGLTLPDLVSGSGLPEADVRRALDQLADLSLLGGDGASLTVAPPRVAIAQAVAAAETEILVRQQQLAELRATMETIAQEHESLLHRESVIRYTSSEAVRARLSELALGATRECISVNPGRSHDAVEMEASRPLNAEALARGVGIRAVYQDASRTDPPTLGYARWLTEEGGEVRTAPSVPVLMILVDGEVALLPWNTAQPNQGAVEVRVPAVVETLAEYFELLWRGADPLGTARHRDVAVEGSVAQALVRLAATGLTDEAAARRLDVSTRTVRRMMAEIMTELGAASRFQAGVEAAQRGWLD
jgi:DNA-binding CsgD family transcriptional regulator